MTKTGDRLIKAMNQAVAYAKADATLRKLEQEAVSILTSVNPPYYFAYSNEYDLGDGRALRARVGEDRGWWYRVGPDDKTVTREEAVYLIMRFQEEEDGE